MHHLRSNAIPADTSGDFNEIIYVNQLQCVVITVILFTSKLATIKNLGTQLDPSKHANILGKSESSPIINSEKKSIRNTKLPLSMQQNSPFVVVMLWWCKWNHNDNFASKNLKNFLGSGHNPTQNPTPSGEWHRSPHSTPSMRSATRHSQLWSHGCTAEHSSPKTNSCQRCDDFIMHDIDASYQSVTNIISKPVHCANCTNRTTNSNALKNYLKH